MKKSDESQLLQLGKVLLSAHEFPWGHALYLPRDRNWTPDTRCLVLDPEIGEEGPDSIPAALEHDLRYSLGMQQVQDVVDNAREQLGMVEANLLLSALEYYFRKDSFINFSKG